MKFFPEHDFHQKTINVPANKTCSLYYGDKLYAQYLGCDGAWNEVLSQSLIDSLEVTRGWTTRRLQIRVGVRTEWEYVSVGYSPLEEKRKMLPKCGKTGGNAFYAG